jgi:hypothetical protein
MLVTRMAGLVNVTSPWNGLEDLAVVSSRLVFESGESAVCPCCHRFGVVSILVSDLSGEGWGDRSVRGG